MPLFYVAVREHTYTGRFYSEAVQAESPEEALQVAAEQAAVPRPPPVPVPQQVFDVAATGPTPTGRLDTDVVQASRREEAPQAAAALRPPPGPAPQGFSVVVREQADAGPVYSEAVQAGSPEEALQVAAEQAAALRSPLGPAPQGFSVVVREQADTGPVYSEVVQAGSPEEALQVAAEQAAAPEPRPGPTPQAETAGRPRCADVWIYDLLHCELETGHDPPHMAVAQRYRRRVRWMRDDRGIAHAVPGPATGAPVPSSIMQPSPVPEPERPEAPFTGAGS